MKAIGVLAAAGALAGCGNLQIGGGESTDRTYDVPGAVRTLQISSGHRVEIVGSDSPGVRVTERLRWSNDHNKPKTSHTSANGTLTLKGRCAEGIMGGSRCQVVFHVRVPRGTTLKIQGGDGSVAATGLTGDVSIRTASGSVTARDLHARTLSVDSEDGRAAVSGEAGTTELTTRTGTIDATGLRTGRFTARSVDGSVRASFAAPPSLVDVDSRTGTIRLGLPANGAYAVTTRLRTGREHVDPAIHRDSQAPNKVNVSSDDGSIFLAPA
ncbi:hypothetical protein ACRB68_49150 [Actinomadura sp. RB68]|uniref:DUF4097 domain-containing protein n=1 Tax=Actinomadura macrotermitis TaxID=2585200 RepID=A0A7K0C068_9ACTN|nr:hypothetical protein [Actinomadura macrotermitis]